MISLIMLLYAGNTSISSFKYSPFKDIVKKLKQWSQSAGNTFKVNLKSGTSETICDNTETIKNISIHVATHLKPLNDEQFGHYLAGLIDGDGHFSSEATKQQLVIVFSSPDVKLAYYIKEVIGFGNVKKVKDKNAYLYIISNKEGLFRVINLINGKLRTLNKFNQVLNNILAYPTYAKENLEFKINDSNNLYNHWIAGFSDADASFQIKFITRDDKPRPEIRLNYQVVRSAKKDNPILLLLKEFFGGNIGYRSSQGTYYYGSTSFGSAKKVINYFDHFHLQSSKHINYLKWRKAYLLIQKKDHLTEKGLDKIRKFKISMNRNSV
uniref:LAGLIDADG endonuclease n=1 Tax=Gibberella zeae TaxID=5518 RepID=A0A6G6BDT8_GIBZA|nr:LAGLIDADG endonuclease [Fusarium graminearum]UPX02048.1 LAGLIDADG endonuclease [Fusarium graminearum]